MNDDANWVLPANQQITLALNAQAQADGWKEMAVGDQATATAAEGGAAGALETYPTPPPPDAATHAYGEGVAGLVTGDQLVVGGDDSYAEGAGDLADARNLEQPGTYRAAFDKAAAARGLFAAAATEYTQADIAFQGAAGQFNTCVTLLGGGGIG